MRKNVRNEKVIRAIAIGLATMIATTSVPVTVFADEGEQVQNGGENQGNGNSSEGEQQNPVTVESAKSDADANANAAEGYTGTMQEGENAASGTIGEMAQEAVNDINNANSALSAGNTFNEAAQNVEDYVELMSAPGTAGKRDDGTRCDYAHQVQDAEKGVNKQADKFGVKLDPTTGEVINTDGLDNKVNTANNEITAAGKAKTEANNALNGVQSAIDTANGLITEINKEGGVKQKADNDTTAANNAVATKSTLDANTQKQLDGIADTLNAAINEENINKAVKDVVDASSQAVKTAGDNLTVAQTALQDAKDAADEAETHSSDYTYQQMQNLAAVANTAAEGAEKAADAAEGAVKTAKEKEEKALEDVSNAQTALKTAQDDAVDVLSEYKGKLKDINDLIDTANGSRKIAQDDMKDANDAIDFALNLMSDTSDPSNAQDKITAMDNAIKKANEAIKKVTDLVYDENIKAKYSSSNISKPERERLKEILKQNDFYKAERKCIDTQTKLTTQLNNLDAAKNTYDKAVEATGTAEENRKKAYDTLKEINKLINGIEGEFESFYDKLEGATEQDIKNIKSILATGQSYEYWEKTATGARGNVDSKGQELEEFVAKDKTFGETEEKLTAEKIVEKYNDVADENNELDKEINGQGGLAERISEKEQIIKDCNSNEGTVMEELRIASEILGQDLDALDKKYVYSYNEETKAYEFVTDENGNPIYTDEYKKLVGRSQATKSEYKCGEEVLAPTAKANYTDANGSKYIIDSDETISMPEWIKSDKVQKIVQQGGAGEVGLDSDSEKLVQSVYCDYIEDIKAGESVFRSDYYNSYKSKKITLDSELDPKTQSQEVNKTIFKEVLNNVLHAELTTEDIILLGDKKFKVSLTSQNASRLNNTQSAEEDYVFSYSFRYTPSVNMVDGSWMLTPQLKDLVFENEGTIHYGMYEAERTYDYKKYDLSVTPTPDALTAQGELNNVDKAAETAKGQLEAHSNAKMEKNQAWDDLKTDRENAAAALYGKKDNEIGTKDKLFEGSLLADKKQKEDTIKANQENILDKLGKTVTEYNTVSNYLKTAEGNLKKADDFDAGSNNYYNCAVDDLGRIKAARDTAKDYQTKANNALVELDKARKNEVDVQKKYDEVKTKIDDSQARLDLVDKKLKALKAEQKKAVANLSAIPVDTKITLDDGTVVDLEDLNDTLNDTLDSLIEEKFNTEDYDPLGYVYPGKLDFNPEELSISVLSEKLAAAINAASGILGREQNKLNEAIKVREKAEEKAGDARDAATKAREEANRAAKALSDWRAPFSEDPGKKEEDPGKKEDPGKEEEDPGKKEEDPGKKEDDPGKKEDDPGKKEDEPERRGTGGDSVIDFESLFGEFIGGGTGTREDSGSGSSSSSDPITYTYTYGTDTYLGFGAGTDTIPLMTLSDTGTGRGRTGAGGNVTTSGVLGVRTEDETDDLTGNTDITKPENIAGDLTVPDKNKTGDQASAKTETPKVTKNIKENEVPLDATSSEPGPGVNLLLLAIVATAGALGFAGYEKQKRRVKATNDKEKKK